MAMIVQARRSPASAYPDSSNAEAGPSRHSSALATDHHQSINALSKLCLTADYGTTGALLLHRLDGRTPNQSMPPQDIDVEEDGIQGSDKGAVDKKGKTPMRPKKYLCPWDECEKSFSKPVKLKDHELSHTGERPHVCTECGASYIRASHLTAHARTHQSPEEKAFQCTHLGCEKRFWTAQHRSRHEKLHEVPLEYECPHCELAFSKHHQLRSHIASIHSPTGTKPFKCTHDGCTWSFPTSQKLKIHQKRHNEARYLCSHEVHGDQGVVFGTWSALRAHIKEEHPPQCPFAECNRRTFKNPKNLREHLKIHADHGDDLEMSGIRDDKAVEETMDADAESMERLEKFEDSDDDPEDPSYLPEIISNLKRKRTDSGVESLLLQNGEIKKLRRSSSDFGKDFGCGEEGCGKRFKTKRALTVHHQTAHLNLRPFVCPHTGCDKTYGHKHLLQRHISARHRNGPTSEVTGLLTTQSSAEPDAEDTVKLLTGFHNVETAVLEKKPLLCPSECVDSFSRCRHRFGRLYDLRRHIKKHHGLDVNEEEVRVMLKDANKAVKANVNQ